MLIPFSFKVSYIEEDLPTDGSTVWSTQAAPLPCNIAVVFIHHQVLGVAVIIQPGSNATVVDRNKLIGYNQRACLLSLSQ
jgi:hypothetical protein